MTCRNPVRFIASLIAIGLASGTVNAVPVTTGLFVQLDGSNLGADGAAVTAWVDQKTDEDGTAANNHQDFGQADATKRPLARTFTGGTAMPNGSTQKVVEFNRVSVTAPNNSSTTSDFLQGSAGGLGATYGGQDAAYEFGGTAGADGMSYFVVYKSRVVTTSTTGTNERLQRQGVLSSDYTAPAGTAGFATFYSDSAGGTVEGTADLFNTVRNQAGTGINQLYGEVASPASWYISAQTWNLDSGAVHSTIIPQNQTQVNADGTSGPWATSIGSSTNIWLGAASAATTNGQHLDGWIAEVLVYNASLSTSDFNDVLKYLNQKYLVNPQAISAAVTPASNSLLGNLDTVQVSNAAATNAAIRDRDSMTIANLAVTGTGFDQSGLANGAVAAGLTQTGTIGFTQSSTMLNGPAYGTLTFDVQSGVNGTGTGAGAKSYSLLATVSGNSGTQSSLVPSGRSYTGLSGTSDAGTDTVATILGGSADTLSTVAIAWSAQGDSRLISDVLDLTGMAAGDVFVLQMAYADFAGDVAAQAAGELYLGWFDGSDWVNAVDGNTGNSATVAMQNFNGSYTSFLAANGGTLTESSMLGAWGVDTSANTVWAVLNHNSEFSAVLVPEPSCVLLGSLGLLGLVVARRRRN